MHTSLTSENVLPRRKRLGFTLVELLVVIGIIALLISILLPVLGGARESAYQVSCASNNRQILQSIKIYTSENRDSYPYGMYFHLASNPGDPATVDTANSPDGGTWFYTYFKQIESLMDGNESSGETAGGRQVGSGMLFTENDFGEVWRCPTVSEGFTQPVTYGQLHLAMPDNYAGFLFGEEEAYLRPAKESSVFADNALLWDAPAWTDWNEVGTPGTASYDDGSTNLMSWTGIHFQQQFPLGQWQNREVVRGDARYRSTGGQASAYDGDFFMDEGLDIFMPSVDTFGWDYNRDGEAPAFLDDLNTFRPRHKGDTAGNVGFADGHVETKRISSTVNDDGIFETDFKIRSLKIKRPSGY